MTTIYGLWYEDNGEDKGGWAMDGAGNVCHSKYACVMAAQRRWALGFVHAGDEPPEVKIIGADGLPDERTDNERMD
jgi:hypothetical protein